MDFSIDGGTGREAIGGQPCPRFSEEERPGGQDEAYFRSQMSGQCDDLSLMEELSEDGIVAVIKEKFARGEIYVSCYNDLVTVHNIIKIIWPKICLSISKYCI